MAGRMGTREEAPPGSILIVIHDFVARSEDELSLAKGDRIELIERDDEFGDGWFLGRHMGNAKTGLFPEGTLVCEGMRDCSANGEQSILRKHRKAPSLMPTTSGRGATAYRELHRPVTVQG